METDNVAEGVVEGEGLEVWLREPVGRREWVTDQLTDAVWEALAVCDGDPEVVRELESVADAVKGTVAVRLVEALWVRVWEGVDDAETEQEAVRAAEGEWLRVQDAVGDEDVDLVPENEADRDGVEDWEEEGLWLMEWVEEWDRVWEPLRLPLGVGLPEGVGGEGEAVWLRDQERVAVGVAEPEGVREGLRGWLGEGLRVAVCDAERVTEDWVRLGEPEAEPWLPLWKTRRRE